MTTRTKTILIGWAIIGSVFLGVGLIGLGAILLPDWLGDTFRSIAGVLGTPFIMETFFSITGLFIVLTVNSYRRQQEQDTEYLDYDSIPRNEAEREARDRREKQ